MYIFAPNDNPSLPFAGSSSSLIIQFIHSIYLSDFLTIYSIVFAITPFSPLILLSDLRLSSVSTPPPCRKLGVVAYRDTVFLDFDIGID